MNGEHLASISAPESKGMMHIRASLSGDISREMRPLPKLLSRIERGEPDPQRLKTARHELLHTVAADFRITKLSVVPEGDSLGRVFLEPISDHDAAVAAVASTLGSNGYGSDLETAKERSKLSISALRAEAHQKVNRIHPEIFNRACEMIAFLGEATREEILRVFERAAFELQLENIDLSEKPLMEFIETQDWSHLFGDEARFGGQVDFFNDKIVFTSRKGTMLEKDYCSVCNEVNGHKETCAVLQNGAVINLTTSKTYFLLN